VTVQNGAMTPLRTLSLWPATLLAAMVLTLSACGGGDSPSTPSPLVPGVANAGQLKDATPINTVTLADLTAAVGAAGSKLPGAVPRYAVTSWRLTYMTSDGFGREVLASGLVSVPVKPDGARSPVLSYQHATIYKDAQAPSNQVAATEPPSCWPRWALSWWLPTTWAMVRHAGRSTPTCSPPRPPQS
jgi:hypothetical protein